MGSEKETGVREGKPAGFSVLKGRKFAFPSDREEVFTQDPTCPGGSLSDWVLHPPPGLDSGTPDLLSLI